MQVERHHKTGEKEIDFPDGTRKTILPSGRQISEFPDGVTVVEYPEVRFTVLYLYRLQRSRTVVFCLGTLHFFPRVVARELPVSDSSVSCAGFPYRYPTACAICT